MSARPNTDARDDVNNLFEVVEDGKNEVFFHFFGLFRMSMIAFC